MPARILRRLRRLALLALHRTAGRQLRDGRPAPPRHGCTALCAESRRRPVPRPRIPRDG